MWEEVLQERCLRTTVEMLWGVQLSNYAGTVMIFSSTVIDAMKAFASHMIVSWTVRHVTCAIVELATMSKGASFVPGHVSRIAHVPVGSQQRGQGHRDSVRAYVMLR